MPTDRRPLRLELSAAQVEEIAALILPTPAARRHRALHVALAIGMALAGLGAVALVLLRL